MEILGDILSDPEVKKSISDLIHVLWHYKVQPKIQRYYCIRIKGHLQQPQTPLALNKFFKQKQNKFYLHKLLFRIQKILHLSLFLSQMNRLHFC